MDLLCPQYYAHSRIRPGEGGSPSRDPPLEALRHSPQPVVSRNFSGSSAMSEPMVLQFAEIDPGQLPLVGGKALNLGRLARAGLPVPPGFVLTTAAYRRRGDP